ncbi:MAG: PAS domain-containing protein [Granulosicoccus sp.]
MNLQSTQTVNKHYLQEELEQLIKSDPSMWKFLQEGSLDGIWYWDLEHPDQEYMSPEMWRLFGIDPSTKKHDPAEWQDLIFQEDLDRALENFQAHCADPKHPYDQIVRYRHADGSTVWVRCRGVAIRDEHGNAIRMLGAHNDLTMIKRAEQNMKASNERLVAANTELRSFAYSVSHDMKAPANTLDMLLSEMTSHLQDKDDQEGLELANFGRHAVDRMRSLIEDVLDYTRVVGQRLEFEDVDLESCVTDVIEDLAADIKEKSAHIEVGHLATIRASGVQMRLLFQNLISNALKFQQEGTSPLI